MKQCREFVVNALVGGLLVVVPAYLALLLLLKAMQSLVGLVRPFAMLFPEWVPAENVLSLLLVLMVCFLIGVAVRTPTGRATRERIEKALFERIPGYALFRSLTQQLAGESRENVWKPALAEIEDALVSAFIIEELEDGRFTVFVPSVPTPLACIDSGEFGFREERASSQAGHGEVYPKHRIIPSHVGERIWGNDCMRHSLA